MLNWHSLIYLSEDVKDEYAEIREKLESGTAVSGVYLITLAANPAEQLDIINSVIYAADSERYSKAVVVGLAKGRGQAQELVAKMAEDVFSKTGGIEIRKYFEDGGTRL